MAEVHRILKEMYIGMAVCMIVFLAIGAFFMRPYYIFALALLVGNLGGALRIYHIKHLLTAQIHALQSNNLFPFISNKYIKYQCNFTN